MPFHYPHSNTPLDETEAMKLRFDTIGFHDVVEAFVSSGLGLTPVSVRRPDSYGTRHVIYIVTVKQTREEFVFRSNIGFSGSRERVLLAEKLIADKLTKLNVPVNEILYVDISRTKVPFDFQIQKQVAGFDLEDHFSGTQAEYDDMSRQIGAITAKIHQVKLDGFGRFDDHIEAGTLRGDMTRNTDYIMLDVGSELADLTLHGHLASGQNTAISAFFQDRKDLMSIEHGSLVHYDIADHNIMFDGSIVTGIIDWEAAVVSDPMLDFGSMPTWKTHYPRLEEFKRGYGAVVALPDHFEEKYQLYKLRTLLWKTVFCQKAGILTPERLARLTSCLEENKIA